MDFLHTISNLQQALSHQLPGESAHRKMARFGRKLTFHHQSPPQQAAVMCLLFPAKNQAYFPLIKRISNPNDPHSGQISFPGGRKDGQEALADTAFRETDEEIGINKNSVNLIGALSPVYVPVSNYLIAPFIGYLDTSPEFVLQESEVADVLSVPVAELIAEEKVKTKDLLVRQNMLLKSVPYFDFSNQVVWGATAMILSELKEILITIR